MHLTQDIRRSERFSNKVTFEKNCKKLRGGRTSGCYGLNYVPPKLTCGSLNLQRDGMWTEGLWEGTRVTWSHEGGALRTGLVSF